MLFLGLVASLACFIIWNLVIDKLGNVTSTNYAYLNRPGPKLASSHGTALPGVCRRAMLQGGPEKRNRRHKKSDRGVRSGNSCEDYWI